VPHIQVFPAQAGFPSREAFAESFAQLRASGEYHLTGENAVPELPVGSVVLFRYADEVVGEGVVREYIRGVGDEARVIFAPGSIRFFKPPLLVEIVQEVIGRENDMRAENGYCVIDQGLYLKLLASHVRDRRGEFG